ncbi:ABC transporter [Streptomyces sp. L7]
MQAHRRLTYVPGDVALSAELASGGSCIDILGRLQGGLDPKRRDALIERFELDLTKRTRTYSKGNRQKVALVAALSVERGPLPLRRADLGLDPLMENVFQQCVRELKEAGGTVLLSSHILSEVEALCDRVSIVRHGMVVREGTLADLRSHTLTTVTAITGTAVTRLADLDGIVDLTAEQQPDGVHTRFRVGRAALAIAVGHVAAADPTALTVEPPSLDELFLTSYRTDTVVNQGTPA